MTGNKFVTKGIHLLTYLYQQRFYNDVIKMALFIDDICDLK